MNALDKFLLAVAPTWALARVRARAQAAILERHFEAASSGYRTENWSRRTSDANAANGPALSALRTVARDLHRNNGWAKNAVNVIGRNTVGWGVMPKAVTENDATASVAMETWKQWAETTQCDSEGRLTFYGLQRQVLETVALSGEVLVRMRPRYPEEKLAIPLQLQVLEPDFLDANKDGLVGDAGGPIVQGIEFDKLGRRAAYWLFEQHPGANSRAARTFVSKRVPAQYVSHVYRCDRPGQVRGTSWLAAAIVGLKDFDDFEDASLVRQKIAACYAVFVKDLDGGVNPIGTSDGGSPAIETLQPGMIVPLAPGKDVSFASPPTVVDGEFSVRTLRKIAAGIGVTYEDLTGDYSNVNFSSARMARLSHWANVQDWRWNVLIPQFCDVVWNWAMQLALLAGRIDEVPLATWTPPPMPMIEPDKEGLALMRLVRAGAMTPDEMVREQGYDPDTHWDEYEASLKKLDDRKIILDSDARKVTQAGLTQTVNAKATDTKDAGEAAKDAEEDRALDSLLVEAARDLAGARSR